ncbi:MAG: aspartate aminotransferase family protein [Gemmatimonadetes bacterium]|nr:aspartate aminotransferase family protein [Gemmatimonadota bacterium]
MTVPSPSTSVPDEAPTRTTTARYRDSSSRASALYERARRVMPGGNTRHSIATTPHGPYMVRGVGCRLFDEEGEERIDFLNNYTSLIHGHAHPDVVAAVEEQVRRGTAFGAPTALDVGLAELLVDRIPGVESLRFCNSGTEALLIAIKSARAFTGRPKIAKIEGAYHGVYDFAQVSERAGPEDWGDADRPESVGEAGCSPSAVSEVVVLPWNEPEACARLIDEHREELAAVVVDALPGALGLIPPAPGFLERLRAATERADVLMIADEVLTFRLGYHGAFARHEVVPDLTCLGKVIGGGFPVGAAGGRSDIMDVFDHTKKMKVSHGGTYSGNPVTMAAGLAAMERMTPKAYDRLEELGDRLRHELRELFRRRNTPAQVFGSGSLFSAHLTAEPLTDYRALHRHTLDVPIYTALCHAMLERGILMSYRGIFGCLSTPMTDVEVDAFVAALDDSLTALDLA